MARPIIPWMGGKRRLAKHLLPMFPEHQCYVELFCGSAALFFIKEPSRTEVINDIDGELVNLYRVTQHHLEEFCRQFKHALVSRQIYEWLKSTPPETLTDIQRAARFYYLQKLSFGGQSYGRVYGYAPSSPPRLNLLRLEEDLSQAHLRLARVHVEHLGWADCVRRYDRDYTLFYADPPYWETHGYGVKFGLDQYEALADTAKQMKGRMMISINDHPDMRGVFEGLPNSSVDTQYRVSGQGQPKQARELIIKNWE